MQLLSPANRVIAITYDLKSFWDNSYIDVKKDLMSKYKRHYWPNNPYEAIATSKIKRLMWFIQKIRIGKPFGDNSFYDKVENN